MSKRSDFEYLQDIFDSANRIRKYVKGYTYKNFSEDLKTQDAVLRNFEIIGEAAKHLSKDVRGKYPQVSWSRVAKLRDRLIHHYSGINLDIVWGIVEESLPRLSDQILDILKQMKN